MNLKEKTYCVKQIISNPNYSSLSVRITEEDYKKEEFQEIFKDFKFSDGTTLKEINPFKLDFTTDLIQCAFFKNSDNEYRILINNSDTLQYSSTLDRFMKEIEEISKEYKFKNIALKLDDKFILIDSKTNESSNIKFSITNDKVIIENKEYRLYEGFLQKDTENIVKLVNSNKYEIYNIEEYKQENLWNKKDNNKEIER